MHNEVFYFFYQFTCTTAWNFYQCSGMFNCNPYDKMGVEVGGMFGMSQNMTSTQVDYRHNLE